MISGEIIVDTDVLDALEESLKRAPDITRYTINKVALPRIRDKARELLQSQIPPVKYPIQWESDRQRRAFFATDGFGGGIPYRRTGRLLEKWEITSSPIDSGIAVTATNAAPYAPYVIGDRQQRFHRNTGWYQADDKLITLSEYADDELIEAWYSIDWLGVT